ncbi:MAG: serine/threonine-protein kinase [Xenococcaceae cyanobacterium MO_188.B19]|nr:serine/threonine-protein kinase [Xenococcaceae cyanobacterium MO_188.B19]
MLSNSKYLKEGTTLKRRYQIIKLIGEGSFGYTYLAEDTYETDSQGIVVIKKLKSHSDNQVSEVARKKFISEAFSLRKIGYKHYQIPTLFDFFYIDDQFFLVQEYIEGINLATRLNLNSDDQHKVILKEQAAINLLEQLLNILQCLHENKIIHLDIKPLNIIWRKKDNKYFLIDFGCVKDVSTYNLIEEQIYSPAILGTPYYMPKEQSMGNPRYNSDIYALGIVVIQSVTGLNCIDFKYDSNGKLIWQNKANISPKFQKILNTMIGVEYYENCRYQTVAQVLEDLKSIKQENSLKAITKLLPSRIKSFLYQYWKLVA